MMVLLGTFHVIEGIVALFRDQYFLVGSRGLTVHVSYTTWGWIHILGGPGGPEPGWPCSPGSCGRA